MKFKTIFVTIIIVIAFGGFLWNCTFFMDAKKYPDRLTCGVNQYMNAAQYVVGVIFSHRMEKVENKIEKLQNIASSGGLDNFQTGSSN